LYCKMIHETLLPLPVCPLLSLLASFMPDIFPAWLLLDCKLIDMKLCYDLLSPTANAIMSSFNVRPILAGEPRIPEAVWNLCSLFWLLTGWLSGIVLDTLDRFLICDKFRNHFPGSICRPYHLQEGQIAGNLCARGSRWALLVYS
jgi:hypothetical protein